MSKKVFHVLGNGDKASYYLEENRVGTKLLCNMPPFEMPPDDVYGTCMVDFKMMMALTEGSVRLDQYMWILGTRPREWMYQRSDFHMKYATNIKEFYTHVPKYAGNATNFNCGHMAVHYAASKGAEEINMYGFDTIFDFNMRSVTDLVLSSDRTQQNNYRLLNNWRPVWRDIMREFPNTKFILHHNHDGLKIPLLDNVEVKVYNDALSNPQQREDKSDISDGRGMDQQAIEPGVSIKSTK
tara:strand:+ start:146 stop:865 length:720 start_codon:yes stop_codon:yes gene_type:complete